MGTISGRRLLVAGTGSGCGKTTAVCGILYGLRKRGLRVEAWKSGPDYIDPMFHARVLGRPGGNLDLFFSGETGVCQLLERRLSGADVGVIEGAMGYYDGIGLTGEASSYALARVTGTPVILLVDGAGMGGSVLALLEGFLGHEKPSGIAGVLFNRISGKRYGQLKPCVERLGVAAVGYIPAQREFSLKSRHLGLVTAGEVDGFSRKLEKFYGVIEHTVDWEALLLVAAGAPSVSYGEARAPSPPLLGRRGDGPLIGVARDEAFCFLYEDNVRYLESQGCRPVFFSPLRDAALPEEIDGLLLCGGYPELYGAALSQNAAMRAKVREAVLGGLPCIAECGGFLYLLEQLEDRHGISHEMAGVLPGRGYPGRGLGPFGYVQLRLSRGKLFGSETMEVRAHEFHYFRCDKPGVAFQAVKASGEGEWMTGTVNDDLYAGFPHIYFCGNEGFARAFLQRTMLHGRAEGREWT